MALLGWSPSQQSGNSYAGGLPPGVFEDSEHYWMENLAGKSHSAWLRQASGIPDVIINTGSINGQCNESNRLNVTHHIAQHTNAGGGHGTEIFYYSGSAEGLRLARCLYEFIAPASDDPDRGIHPSTYYGELRLTDAIAVIIEYAFHDNVEDANEIRNSLTEYAEATVKGMCKFYGKTYKPPVVAEPCVNFCVHMRDHDVAEFTAFCNSRGKTSRHYHSGVTLPAAAPGSWQNWPPNN